MQNYESVEKLIAALDLIHPSVFKENLRAVAAGIEGSGLGAGNYNLFRSRCENIGDIFAEDVQEAWTHRHDSGLPSLSDLFKMSSGLELEERTPGILDTRQQIGAEIVDGLIGKSSEGQLPMPESASEYVGKKTPALKPELIQGIVRKGKKVAIVGARKSMKSMEAIYIAVCLATGREWRGHKCEKSKVLVINVEIDREEWLNRLNTMLEHLRTDESEIAGQLDVVHLSGVACNGHRPYLEDVYNAIKEQYDGKKYDIILFDPLYKLFDGDENSAADVNKNTFYFDTIRKETGATVLFVHHTGKGGDANKDVFEMLRGSSAFGDDADAVIGISQLYIPRNGDVWTQLENAGIKDPERGAFIMRFGLRSFEDPAPIRLIRHWPVLFEDVGGMLDDRRMKGDPQGKANETKQEKKAERDSQKQKAMDIAISNCHKAGIPPKKDTLYETFLPEACEAVGLDYPAKRTWKGWMRDETGRPAPTSYRTDPKTQVVFDTAG